MEYKGPEETRAVVDRISPDGMLCNRVGNKSAAGRFWRLGETDPNRFQAERRVSSGEALPNFGESHDFPWRGKERGGQSADVKHLFLDSFLHRFKED